MIGKRLKQLRLSRGFSLDDLANATGNVVTKQALSKYERGLMNPKPSMYIVLGKALGIKPASLLAEPRMRTEVVAYRKDVRLLKKEQARVESLVTLGLEKRIKLQELTTQDGNIDIPIQSFGVGNAIEAADAAQKLRNQWGLGDEPIASMVAILESRLIHVMEIETDDTFEAISALSFDEEKNTVAACLATRKGISGERQRLSLAHELGHICMCVSQDYDQEKAAWRFGSAFLAPAAFVRETIGIKRHRISIYELRLHRKQLGMSMSAILHRLVELEIITLAEYNKRRRELVMLGWDKEEPDSLCTEEPSWFQRAAYRAASEGLIGASEARDLGVVFEDSTVSPWMNAGKMSMNEREKFLQKASKDFAKIVASDGIDDFETGDIDFD